MTRMSNVRNGSKADISLTQFSALRRRPAALRRLTASSVQPPCFQAPLAAPFGAPEPTAPPCIRHTRFPLTAGDRQQPFCRV